MLMRTLKNINKSKIKIIKIKCFTNCSSVKNYDVIDF